MYKAVIFLTLIAASSAQYLPNGCPSNFHIHFLLPHETDCKKYYQCSNGVLIEMNCGEGTYFDSISRLCTWPWMATCHIESSSESQLGNLPNGCPADFLIPRLLPHETDCSKFYKCSYGQKIEQNCSDGNLFDIKEERCYSATLATCAPGAAIPTTSTPATPTTPEIDYLPNGCPSNFKKYHLLPHKSDCDKFYQCSNGQKIEMLCAPGTHFSFELQGCDFPIFAKCSMASTTTTTTITSAISSTTTASPTTSGTDLLPNGCPINWHIHLLLPHEFNCAKYYQCVHGSKVERDCGPETWFDYNLQVCNHISMVNCVPGSPTLSTTKAPTSAVPTTTKPANPTTELDLEYLPNGCPVDYNTEKLLPHESDCAKYYQCTHGIKVERDCALGTWFDYDKQLCNWPAEVNCVITTTVSPTTISPTTPQSTTSTTVIASSTTTNKPIEILPNGCPAEFSTDYILLPHDTHCDKYYQCSNGYKIERDCAAGTWFDFDKQECDWPQNVHCHGPRPTTEDPNITEATDSTTEGSTAAEHTTTTQVPSTTQGSTTKSTTTAGLTSAKPATTEDSTTLDYSTTDWSTTPDFTTITDVPTTLPLTTIEASERPETTTTEASTTQEPTTTEVSTTREPATTDSSTTLKPTTTEASTTKEPITTETLTTPVFTTIETSTTSQPTTIVASTSQEPTTFEPTTEASTTREPTPTEDSTTLDPTTTQGSTTSELITTTDIPTTPKLTTTEGSTTPEKPTTTDILTTFEPNTTQGSTTPELITTTYVPTTFEPTTTQGSTTPGLITTTYVPTTFEPTTTQDSTTPELITTTYFPTTFEPTATQGSSTPGLITTTYTPTTEMTTKPVSTTTTDFSTSIDYSTTAAPTSSDLSTTDASTDDSTTPGLTTTDSSTTLRPTTTVASTTPEGSTVTDDWTTVQPTTTDASTTLGPTTTVEAMTPEATTVTDGWTTAQPTTTDASTTLEPTTTETLMTPEATTVTDDSTTVQLTTTDASTTLEPTTTVTLATPEATTVTDDWTTAQTTTTDASTTLGPTTTVAFTTPEATTVTDDWTTVQPTTTDASTTLESTATVTLATPEATTVTDDWTTTQPTTTHASTTLAPTTIMTSTIPESSTVIDEWTTAQPTTTDASTTSESTTPTTGGSTTGHPITTDASTAINPSTTETSTTTGSFTTTEVSTTADSTTVDALTTLESSTTVASESTTTTDPSTIAESTTTEASTTIESSTTPLSTTIIDFSTTPGSIATTDVSTTVDPATESTTEAYHPCPDGTYGNVPHPDICDSFYLCMNGVAVQLWCGAGYEFDPVLGTCQPISEGGCTLASTTPPTVTTTTDSSYISTSIASSTTDSSITTTDADTQPDLCPPGVWGNIPHPDSCNAFFICAGGNTIQLWCSVGFEFDPESKNCVPIAEGGCTLGQDTTTMVPTPTTDKPINQICLEGTWGNVAHPEICNSFYICTGGTSIQLFCSDGYEFDPESRICVKITEGGCTYSHQTTPVTKPATNYPSSTTSNNYDTTSDNSGMTSTHNPTYYPNTDSSVTATPNNPCSTGFWGTIPHPKLCNSFYICTDGNFIEILCNEGFEFDPHTSSCVKIVEGGCTLSSATTTVRTTTHSISTTGPTTVSPIELCPAGAWGNIPHPDICESYYMCVGGNAIQVWCSTGWEFDPKSQVCVEIAAGGCTLGHTTTVVPTTKLPTTTPIRTTTDVTEIDTQAPTEFTTKPNTYTTTVVTTETTVITTPTTSLCSPNSWGNVPHPEICESYYMCVGGFPIQLWCSTEYEYDNGKQKCVPIVEGGCTYASKSTTTGTHSTTSGTTSVEDEETSTVAITTTTTEASTTPVPKTICKDGEFGNKPHPKQCNEFYMCAGGDALHLFCSSGYEFDPQSSDCVPITEGGCTLGSSPTTFKPQICPVGVWGNVPHPTICNAFYMCASGIPILLFCSEGFEFNPHSGNCVPIVAGGCTVGYDTTTDDNIDVTIEEIFDYTTEATSKTDNITNATNIETDTTVEYTEATMKPLPTLTTQRFTDEPTRSTVTEESSTTSRPAVPTTVTTSTEVEHVPTNTESTSIKTTTDGLALICRDGEVGRISHPELCNSYYMCDSGSVIQAWCGTGWEFDKEIKECVEIAEGGCTLGLATVPVDITIPDHQTGTSEKTTVETTAATLSTIELSSSTASSPTRSTTVSTSTETEPSTTENVIISTQPTEDLQPICPSGTFGNVPHPELCNTYYMCVGGNAIQVWCTSGWEFDKKTKECVKIAEGGCTLGPITAPGNITIPDHETGPSEKTTVDVATSTTSSPVVDTTGEEIATVVSTTVATSTETENDPITTENKSTMPPDEDLLSICPSGTFGNIPHPELCNTYYMCVGGNAIQVWCVAGWEFDKKTKECVEIAAGGCTLGTTTPTITYSTTTTSEEISTTTDKTDDSQGTTADATTQPTTLTFTEQSSATTENSTNGFDPICPEGVFGNVPHPELCSTYYVCAGGSAIQVWCAEGWEFDKELKTCVEIDYGGCTLGSATSTSKSTTPTVTEESSTTHRPILSTTVVTSTEAETVTTENIQNVPTTEGSEPICPDNVIGNVPHPAICNSYYMCVGGNAIQVWCVAGWEFNKHTKECVEIGAGGCTLGPTTPSHDTSTSEKTQASTEAEDLTTTTELTTEYISTTEGPVAICSDGRNRKIPHPDICNSYYQCSKGITIQVWCADGWEFNPKTLQCIPAVLGGCTLNQTMTTDRITTNQVLATEETISLTTETTETTICPVSVWGNVPHPNHCDSYYMCVGGTAIQVWCTSGWEFSPELKECVLISEGGCTLGSGTPESDSSTLIPTTEPNLETTSEPPVCPIGYFGNVAHPNQCALFYLCVGVGNPLLLQCTEGFEFSPVVKECVGIAEGGCTLGPEVSESENLSTTETPYLSTSITTKSDASPTTTEATTIPTSVVTEVNTDEVTTPTLPTTSLDQTQTTTEGELTTTAVPICPDGYFGNLPHPELCSSFYRCFGFGQPILLPCRDGFEFDPEPSECVEIAAGGCFLKSIAKDAINVTQSSPPGTVASTEKEYSPPALNPNLTNITLILEEKPLPTIAPICPEGYFGTIPHPTLCAKYYRCTGDREPILMACKEGLEFNIESNVCKKITKGGCTHGPLPMYEDNNSNATSVKIDGTLLTWDYSEENVEFQNVDFIMPTTTQVPTCPDDYFGNLPHPQMCSSFYRCFGMGHPVLLPCPDGFEFNPKSSDCVVITPGGCSLGNKAKNPGGTIMEELFLPIDGSEDSSFGSPVTCPVGYYGAIEHPKDCSAFYKCLGLPTAALVQCSPGFEFNPEAQVCVEIATGGCTLSNKKPYISKNMTARDIRGPKSDLTEQNNSSQDTSDSNVLCPPGYTGLVRHPEYCSQFYKCIDEIPHMMFCNAGDEFDVDLKMCIHITEGGCTLSGNTKRKRSLQSQENEDDAEISEKTFACPEGIDGRIADPEICNMFYYCSEGIGEVIFCAKGLEFDPQTKLCLPISKNGCTAKQERGN